MREIILSMGTKLDRNSSRQLRKALQKNLQSGELVCFDASELQHSDATGLAELFAMIAVILGRGGEAIVSGHPPTCAPSLNWCNSTRWPRCAKLGGMLASCPSPRRDPPPAAPT